MNFNKRCSSLNDFLYSRSDELKLLKKSDKIILPIINTSFTESIEEVKVVSYKNNYNLAIKTKSRISKSSIFVSAFQAIQTFPNCPLLNYYDPVE